MSCKLLICLPILYVLYSVGYDLPCEWVLKFIAFLCVCMISIILHQLYEMRNYIPNSYLVVHSIILLPENISLR